MTEPCDSDQNSGTGQVNIPLCDKPRATVTRHAMNYADNFRRACGASMSWIGTPLGHAANG